MSQEDSIFVIEDEEEEIEKYKFLLDDMAQSVETRFIETRINDCEIQGQDELLDELQLTVQELIKREDDIQLIVEIGQEQLKKYESLVKRHQQELFSKSNEIQNLSNIINNFSGQVIELESQCNRLQNENDNLQKKVDDYLTQEILQQNQKYKEQQENQKLIERTQNTEKELTSEIKNFTQEIKRKQDTISQKSQEIQELREINRRHILSNQELKTQIRRISTQLQIKTNIEGNLQSHIKNLEENFKDLIQQNKQLHRSSLGGGLKSQLVGSQEEENLQMLAGNNNKTQEEEISVNISNNNGLPQNIKSLKSQNFIQQQNNNSQISSEYQNINGTNGTNNEMKINLNHSQNLSNNFENQLIPLTNQQNYETFSELQDIDNNNNYSKLLHEHKDSLYSLKLDQSLYNQKNSLKNLQQEQSLLLKNLQKSENNNDQSQNKGHTKNKSSFYADQPEQVLEQEENEENFQLSPIRQSKDGQFIDRTQNDKRKILENISELNNTDRITSDNITKTNVQASLEHGDFHEMAHNGEHKAKSAVQFTSYMLSQSKLNEILKNPRLSTQEIHQLYEQQAIIDQKLNEQYYLNSQQNMENDEDLLQKQEQQLHGNSHHVKTESSPVQLKNMYQSLNVRKRDAKNIKKKSTILSKIEEYNKKRRNGSGSQVLYNSRSVSLENGSQLLAIQASLQSNIDENYEKANDIQGESVNGPNSIISFNKIEPSQSKDNTGKNTEVNIPENLEDYNNNIIINDEIYKEQQQQQQDSEIVKINSTQNNDENYNQNSLYKNQNGENNLDEIKIIEQTDQVVEQEQQENQIKNQNQEKYEFYQKKLQEQLEQFKQFLKLQNKQNHNTSSQEFSSPQSYDNSWNDKAIKEENLQKINEYHSNQEYCLNQLQNMLQDQLLQQIKNESNNNNNAVQNIDNQVNGNNNNIINENNNNTNNNNKGNINTNSSNSNNINGNQIQQQQQINPEISQQFLRNDQQILKESLVERLNTIEEIVSPRQSTQVNQNDPNNPNNQNNENQYRQKLLQIAEISQQQLNTPGENDSYDGRKNSHIMNRKDSQPLQRIQEFQVEKEDDEKNQNCDESDYNTQEEDHEGNREVILEYTDQNARKNKNSEDNIRVSSTSQQNNKSSHRRIQSDQTSDFQKFKPNLNLTKQNRVDPVIMIDSDQGGMSSLNRTPRNENNHMLNSPLSSFDNNDTFRQFQKGTSNIEIGEIQQQLESYNLSQIKRITNNSYINTSTVVNRNTHNEDDNKSMVGLINNLQVQSARNHNQSQESCYFPSERQQSTNQSNLFQSMSPFKKFMDEDSQKDKLNGKRVDPYEEYFKLSCQAAKLNSKYFNQIFNFKVDFIKKEIDEKKLPFNKWYDYISERLHQKRKQLKNIKKLNKSVHIKP